MPKIVVRLESGKDKPIELPRLFKIDGEETVSQDCTLQSYKTLEVTTLSEPRSQIIIWAENSYITIDGTRHKLLRTPKLMDDGTVIFSIKPWLHKARRERIAPPWGSLLTPKK